MNALGERLNRQMNDAKRVIHALESSGPLTGEQIEEVTGLDHDQSVAAVFYLIVSGTISDDGRFLMLTQAAETPRDAQDKAETGIGTTPEVECSTEQCKRLYDEDWNLHRQAMHAVAELGQEYQAMREELQRLREVNSDLVADSDAYHALKEKLREMLDD